MATSVSSPPGASVVQHAAMPGTVEFAQRFAAQALQVAKAHSAQTLDDVLALRDKYATPTFGSCAPFALVEMLAQCIDPSDTHLYCASQQMHVLQMLDAMEHEGTASADFVLVALVHDVGKALLLTDEPARNIVGFNEVVRTGEPGCGWDQCDFQWNHDEWAYVRLKDHVPDALAWLVRYHSVRQAGCEEYMDARDHDYARRYLHPFQRYDHATKSPLNLPLRRASDYRAVLERALPAQLPF